MDQAVRKRRVVGVRDTMTRHITYEVPDRVHDGGALLTEPPGVEVYHVGHAARFFVPQWLAPRGHFVYMVWGVNDVERNGEDYDVLYIGMSSKVMSRLGQHATDSPWWHYAEHVDIYEYETREAAAAVEEWLIASYGPLYNVQYKAVESIELEVAQRRRRRRVLRDPTRHDGPAE